MPEFARRRVPRLLASPPSARPQAQRARPRAPRSHRRAMLHLSEFSGPDALMAKSAEGCCSEPSTEVSRLPARDAPAAVGYPGGKEHGRGCSDGGAVRGRTMPENRQGLGRRRCGGRSGRSGVPGCALLFPSPPGLQRLHRKLCVFKQSFCLCTCVSCVHICVCVLGLMPAPNGSECAKGALYVSVRTKGSLGRGYGLRGAPFYVPGADSCSFLSRRLLELGIEQLRRWG